MIKDKWWSNCGPMPPYPDPLTPYPRPVRQKKITPRHREGSGGYGLVGLLVDLRDGVDRFLNHLFRERGGAYIIGERNIRFLDSAPAALYVDDVFEAT